MVALNLYIVFRLLGGLTVPSFSTFVLGAAVLVSQGVFWGGIAYYLEVPTVDGFVIFSLAVQFMMVPVGLWFVTLVFEAGERPVRSSSRAWPVGLGLLLLVNELLMSWAFAAMVPGSLPTDLASAGALGRALLVASSTAWYYWPMGAAMLVLARWSGLPLADRRALYTLTLSAFVAPWAFEMPLVGAVAMGGVMAVAVLILWQGAASPVLTRASLRLRIAVVAAFVVMSATWAVSYALLPSAWGLPPFAIAMVTIMTVELVYLLQAMLFREGRAAVPPEPDAVFARAGVAPRPTRSDLPAPAAEPQSSLANTGR